MKINSFAFQGVNGAYSEQAGKNVYPDYKSVPCATFEEMFACVRNDKAEIALVPIENSQAGRVADTGIDPVLVLKNLKRDILEKKLTKTKILWASPREVFNIYQAQEIGVDIITVTKSLIDKLSLK